MAVGGNGLIWYQGEAVIELSSIGEKLPNLSRRVGLLEILTEGSLRTAALVHTIFAIFISTVVVAARFEVPFDDVT